MKRIVILTSVYFLLFSTVSAQSVDILWQADTYTPPFYQGKVLWSKQSTITFVAIPDKLGSPRSLVYRWIRNGTVLGSLSGPGKNSLTLTDSILSKAQNIKVEIVSEDDYESPILAETSIVVSPVNSSLIVYENNPLYGFMFHRAIGNTFSLRQGEVTFGAFPMFFVARSRADSALTYAWRTDTGGLETKNTVTYRAPEGASGSSQVSLSVSNESEIAQEAKKSFLVEF